MAEPIHVSVVCAAPDRVFLRELRLAPGSTVADAVEQSGLYRQWPGMRQVPPRYGVFSKPTDGTARLRDGDRVEVYRPLLVDPKQARRERANARRE
jgi:putative ubiquitin-RnfH superfamily antitoxin RatB of RatAB toxin-antitoxin module